MLKIIYEFINMIFIEPGFINKYLFKCSTTNQLQPTCMIRSFYQMYFFTLSYVYQETDDLCPNYFVIFVLVVPSNSIYAQYQFPLRCMRCLFKLRDLSACFILKSLVIAIRSCVTSFFVFKENNCITETKNVETIRKH